MAPIHINTKQRKAAAQTNILVRQQAKTNVLAAVSRLQPTQTQTKPPASPSSSTPNREPSIPVPSFTHLI